MADDYGLMTTEPVLTAEEMARRNYAIVRARKQRDEEIEKRRKALIEQAETQAGSKGEDPASVEGRQRHKDAMRKGPQYQKQSPPAKTVNLDGKDIPLDEAISKIPEEIDFDEFVLSSPLRDRALRSRRIEDLVAEGKSQAEAEKTAIKEQEGRQAAFKLGQETIRNSPSYVDKEYRALGSGFTNSAVAMGARALGYNQAADEAEATSAGLQSEMSRIRDEQHPYPQIQGALAGAASNAIQMLPGMVSAPITGPGVGMAVMAGQYGSQEYSRAAYEGAEAGLAGDELNRYAAIQGGIEASIMPIFSAIPGLKGLEGRVLRGNIARGVASHPSVRKAIASGAVKFTKDTAAELAEEVTTEVLHGWATQGLLNEDVDYKGIVKDTVLQTLIMMGAAEAAQQVGGRVGQERPPEPPRIDSTRQPVFPGEQAPTGPEEATATTIPPAVEAFTQNPSRKNYEAAVNAGLPPLPKSTTETRAKLAAEMIAAKSQEVTPEPPQATVNESLTVQPPTNPDAAPDNDIDQLLQQFETLFQKGGDPNATQNEASAQNAEDVQQGRQERLLTEPGISLQEATPVATGGPEPDQSQPPSEAGPVSKPEPEAKQPREPWQMSRDEFEASQGSVFGLGRKISASIVGNLGNSLRPSVKDIASAASFFNVSKTDARKALDHFNYGASDRAPKIAWEKYHKPLIESALAEGKPVTPEVLSDYPDLKPSPEPVSQPEPSSPELQQTPTDSKQEDPEPPAYGTREWDMANAKHTLDKSPTVDGFKALTEGKPQDFQDELSQFVKDTNPNLHAALNPKAKPPVPTFAALPQKSQDLFNKAFESKDVESLKQMVAKNNVAWNTEFQNRTGIKLPKTVKGRNQVVLDWAASAQSPEPPAGQMTKDKHAQLPMWDVYPTQINGKAKFAVKQSEKGGFGDGLFDSESDAQNYAKIVRQQSEESLARIAKSKADEEADQKKQQEHEASFQGFLTDDPMVKGRRLKTLDTLVNYEKKPITRKSLVEKRFADGWTVNDKDQFQAPTGEFLDAGALTKTGIDYARHLVNLKPTPPVETQENKAKAEKPAEPSQEDLMEQMLREELLGETKATPAEPAEKPQKTKAESILSKDDVNQLREDVANNSIGFMRTLNQDKIIRARERLNEKGNTAKEIATFERNIQRFEAMLAALDKMERPAKTKTTRTDAAKKRTERTAAELKAAEDDVFKAFGSTMNTGLNPEQMRATARLVKAALNHQVSTFNEFVAYVVDKFGEPMALRMADGIELAWRSLKRLPDYTGIDDAGSVADIVGSKKESVPAKGWAAIPGHFAEQLLKGEQYTSISEARREAGEIIGTPVKPGTAEAKQLDEAIEYGIVQAGRKIVADGGTSAEIYDKLVDLYERQPTLGVRDSNSMEMQAYSTPVPLAWLASTLGNVTDQTKVYEPTAGNGVLLIGTDVKNAFANELDPARAQTLRDQGFKVTQADAATATVPNVQTVLANPPFGKVKDANRKNVEFDVDGFKTTEIDHAIALQSLKGMQPDGHTVLILAAKGHNAKTDMDRRLAYSKGKDRPFYDALYQGYDVTQHFTVDGSLYSRQGASFPVDVIVLRPLGTVSADQKRATPWAQVPRMFSTWQEIRNAHFNKDVADSGTGTGVLSGDGNNGSPDLSTGNADDVGRVSGQDENTAPVAEGNVVPSESEPVVSTPVDGKGRRGRGGKKSGGSRSQSGLSGNAASERSGKGNVSDAAEAGTGSQGLDSGTRPDGMAGTGTAEQEVDPESHQSAYAPSSKNKTVETLVPTNLQDAISMALEAVEEANGPIDAFVQKELGYKKNDKFFNDLSAEQVDAIALAIHSHKSGAGMVVGDMTGVGKGRVAAAMMRYAERQGLVPVFVTEKPDLFGDMYRDLADIGSDTVDAPFFALPTNDTAGAKAIDLPNGRKLQTSKETNSARLDEALSSLQAGKGFMANVDGVPTKINAVFTMYSQLQTVKGEETHRRHQLRDLMPNAFLIMDESHNAGGTVKERVNENAPPDRAALARELVQASSGTMYLSATFAKRPDVMDLYSKTDMAKAVDGDITKLAGVLQAGGLPLQQVLSAMLSESGQYIRREKSFDGIEFAKVDVGVDLTEQDKITDVFRGIRRLDGVVAKVVSEMNDELVAAGEHGVAGDVSTGDAGMTSSSFSSILWNAVDQMLFALKADKAADNAIESWKNGETPILAVDNTMEGIIDEYVTENGLKVGDVVNLNFRDILHRYLERSRWITIDTGMRDARNKKITRKERLTDDQLNVEMELGNALDMFNAAYDIIEATDINAPASPIDWLRYRMQKAGMKVAEITGRKTILIYSDSGVATLGARPQAERGTRGKQETIRRINDGSLDGLILNRSGATGVSVHASEKFKNQKVRHMMIVQPAKNIDEFMQMLGRVNRTGQVVKPRYSLLMSDSPAELRPAAVLAKKLASLNASVTAKSKGAVGFTVTDVMNEVGGAIVSQYLVDNPEFAEALDMEMNELREDAETESLEDVVRKATGRSAILPIEQQREFWDDVTAAYNSRIEELNALNENPLIAQTMDLDAKTLSSVNLFAGKPNEGPFAAPADMERMDVKNPGKPMMSAQVTDKIQEFYGISSMDDRHGAAIRWERETIQSFEAEMPAFHRFAVSNLINPEAIAGRHAKLNTQTEDVISAINNFAPGTVVNFGYAGGGGEYAIPGVVIGFKRTGKTGNPAAPSRWMIEVAIGDAAKKVNVPVSQVSNLSGRMESMDSVLRDFEVMQTRSREKRWIGTGNLVAAYAQLAARNGKLIFYTDDQGNTKRGILMPRAFDANSFLEQKSVPFSNADDSLTFFDQGGSRLTSADGNLIIVKSGNTMSLQAPRARSRGGKYTLNRGIIDASGQDFVSVGNYMVLRSSGRDQQRRILDAVLAVTPLEARTDTDREIARDVLGLNKLGQPTESALPEPSSPSPVEAPESDLRKAAADAKEAIFIQRQKNARYYQDFRDEWNRIVSTPGMGAAITPELLRAAGNIVVGEIRIGKKRFSVLIENLRREFDDAIVLHLKPTLIAMWNANKGKYGLDDATPELFDEAMSDTVDVDVEKAVEAAQAVETDTERTPNGQTDNSAELENSSEIPETDTKRTRWTDSPDADEPTIGINRAKRAERRDELGLEQEDIVNKIGHSFPELDAEAKKVSPGEAEDVFTRIGEGGEAADNASDRDVFVMLNHYAKKQVSTNKTLEELAAARASGDHFKVAELEAALAVQVAEEARLMAIAKNAGTAAGRALAAFKALLKYDMSLARLRMRLDAAADGNPTEAQTAEQIALHAKYEAALKELEAKSKEAEEAITRAEIAEQIARDMKERAAEGKKTKTKADRRLDAALNALGKDLSFFSLSGALQKLPQLVELAGALIEKNMERFEDFVSWTSKRWGKTPKPETLPVLQQAWDTAWDLAKNPQPPKPPEVSIEPDHPESVVAAAKALFRYYLSQGITNTEEVIDLVHDELRHQFPAEIGERLDTMKAMVDYDKTRTLSQDPLDILAADKRAIVQLKAKIEDMLRGIAPRRHEQRYPASDEQRAHIKLFNEEKRKGGFEVTDPERQGKSALAALETRLRHSISDTLNEIASGSRIVPNKTAGPTSDTTEDLKAYLDIVRGMHKAIFGDRTMTQEQKIKAAEAAAVKNEAYWNDRLARAKSGDFSTGKTKPNPVTNANIAAIKARSDLAKAQVAELKALANPKPDPEAISDARYLTSLQNQLAKKLERMADIAARAAAGDFNPERNLSKEKREANAQRRKSDAAIRDARIKLDETTRALNEQIEKVRKAKLTYVDLAKRVPGAAWATLRDLKLTGELSFILKQGGPRVFGALVPAGKIARAGYEAITGNPDAAKEKIRQAGHGYKQIGGTLARTLKAALWKTDTELARSQDALKQRPNYKNGTYEAMRIPVEAHGGPFSVAEELFLNNLIELGGLALDKRFPGFKGFRDGHPTFTKTAHNLNLANRITNATQLFMSEIRADMADDAASLWTMKSGEMTPAEARAYGNVVNAFTGKGDMGMVGMDNEKARNFLSKILISAPWLMSRMQMFSGHPFWSRRATPESKKAAAELYVDMAAGVAAYYGAFALAAMFMDDDDEEKPVVETDSRSTDYLNPRIGRTRMDPLFGLQQLIVLASRIYHGEVKNSRGVVEQRKGFRDDWGLIARFMEGRLHPAIQDIRSLKTGEDFMGQPITKTEVAMRALFPVTYPDIAKASKDRGIPASTAMGIWALAGGPLKTYEPRTKERADIAAELSSVQRKIKNANTPDDVRESLKTEAETMLESHLVNAVKSEASDYGNTALAEQAANHKPGEPMSPELAEAVEKEKQDIILNASSRISTDQRRLSNDEKKDFSGSDDKGRIVARSLVPVMIPDVSDAIRLYDKAYRARNGSLLENGKVKPSVWAGRARIRQLYE